MRRILILLVFIGAVIISSARNVTIAAADEPAAAVFREIVGQTGMNFVYPSDLLEGMRVTVKAVDRPLKTVLSMMFRDTDIEYKIKGKNIILRRKKGAKHDIRRHEGSVPVTYVASAPEPEMLQEVVVTSRLEAPSVETSEIGAKKLTGDEIKNTPSLLGESDVMKALLMQPGINGGAEGMAEMHVHGGNADENMFMLDNVPLYQVNHLGGLFSAFNPDAIRYIDFFKSSIPAKYDGRLSSYLDVRTKNGSQDRRHGSLRLGLTSGAFNIDGPIGRKTTYSVALRRSWTDLVSAPFIAINNASSEEKIRFSYSFMDLNGKVTHRFNNNATGFVSVYFGDDFLKSGSKDKNESENGWYDDDHYDMHWGNLVAQAGFNYRLKPTLTGEFTAAYTRFFSSMKHNEYYKENYHAEPHETHTISKTENNISDWILRGDFDWRLNDNNRVRFGGGYTIHSFLPSHRLNSYSVGQETITRSDSTWSYAAYETNIYIEDDWKISDRFRVNAGFHGSLFRISGKNHCGLGPRLSISYRPTDNWAIKAAYSRTNQYVHMLNQSYLALPTDQWVPITGRQKPQSADKISAGIYWRPDNGKYSVSAEGYYKDMRNLVDYRDEYYLMPPMEVWDAQLCTGKGTAKGIDFKIEKLAGKITGHIAYSLGWADRTFADKNGGRTFPARFDNRHTINILLNWNISRKVQFNAAWTGHSGNRFTLLTQVWEAPGFDNGFFGNDTPLKAEINNYQLPFYHRLDISFTVRNKRGFWNFGLYNAYCHMNTIAIQRSYNYRYLKPVFKKVKFLPLIPSVSYTWQF